MDVPKTCGLDKEVTGWEEELKWTMKRLKGKALISILLRIGWSAFIYHVWREHNNRIFNHVHRTGKY